MCQLCDEQLYVNSFVDESDNEMASDLSEKSEMETLNNLKSATEEALKELKREMSKSKSKGMHYYAILTSH